MFNEIFQATLLASAGAVGLSHYATLLLSERSQRQQPGTESFAAQKTVKITLHYDGTNSRTLKHQLEQITILRAKTIQVSILRNSDTPSPKIALANYRRKGSITIKNKIHKTPESSPHLHSSAYTTEVNMTPWARINAATLQNYLGLFDADRSMYIISQNTPKNQTARLSSVISTFKNIDQEFALRIASALKYKPNADKIEAVFTKFIEVDGSKKQRTIIVTSITKQQTPIRNSSFKLKSSWESEPQALYSSATQVKRFKNILINITVNCLARSNAMIIIAGLIFTLLQPDSFAFSYLWVWYTFFYSFNIFSSKQMALKLKLQYLVYAPVAYFLTLIPAKR